MGSASVALLFFGRPGALLLFAKAGQELLEVLGEFGRADKIRIPLLINLQK